MGMHVSYVSWVCNYTGMCHMCHGYYTGMCHMCHGYVIIQACVICVMGMYVDSVETQRVLSEAVH